METKACHTLEGGQTQYNDLKGMCEKMRRVIKMPVTWSLDNEAITSEACTSVAGVVKAYTKMSKSNPDHWVKVKTCHEFTRSCANNNMKKTQCAPGDVISRSGNAESCRWVIKGAMCPGGAPVEKLAPCVKGIVNDEDCYSHFEDGTSGNPFLSKDMTTVGPAPATTGLRGSAQQQHNGPEPSGNAPGPNAPQQHKNAPQQHNGEAPSKNALQPNKNAPEPSSRDAPGPRQEAPAAATTADPPTAIDDKCATKLLTYQKRCDKETFRDVCPCAGRSRKACKSWAGCDRVVITDSDGSKKNQCVDIVPWTREEC